MSPYLAAYVYANIFPESQKKWVKSLHIDSICHWNFTNKELIWKIKYQGAFVGDNYKNAEKSEKSGSLFEV